MLWFSRWEKAGTENAIDKVTNNSKARIRFIMSPKESFQRSYTEAHVLDSGAQ
jgi:hypothetical protein